LSARAARRLPGLAFESRSPRLPETLPRMDVTAFVGFAAAGPLDTPVALEDPAAFADLYGDDATLAWDRELGEPVRGNLGPAVRAFFRNGGRRAFVVRVAGATAATNHFPVPGLARLTAGGLRPAFLAARSEGTWSDRHDVGAVASVEASPVSKVTFSEGRLARVSLLAPDSVAPGDLLRLTWPGGPALLAAVERLEGSEAVLLDGGALALLPAPPALPSAWTPTFFPRPDAVAQALPPLFGDPIFRDDGTATVTFSGDGPPAIGHLVRLARGDDEVWLAVTSIAPIDLPGSPPARGAEVDGRWTHPTRAGSPLAPAGLPTCDRVRVELWVRDGGLQPRRLDDLGLAPGHPRYLGALPRDQRLFAPDEDLLDDGERALLDRVRAVAGDGADLRTYHADLWKEAATPRFALAADEGQTDLYFPMGLAIVPDVYLGPSPPVTAGAAVRDGLDQFSAAPFLDPDLADESVRSLVAQADHIRWQQPEPRRLTGIYAVLGLDEATLVAVPDAVQRGWTAETQTTPEPLDAPAPVATADAAGNWHLDWKVVDPLAITLVQSSATATFERPFTVSLAAGVIHYDVPPLGAAPAWFRLRAYLARLPDASDAGYFVDADPEAAGSFWSDPLRLVTPPDDFVDCPAGALDAATLSLAAPPDGNGTYRLIWTAVAGALRYVVEESTSLDFLDAAVVFAGSGRDVTIYGRAPGRYHYRVHAEGREATLTPPIAIGSDKALFDVTGVDTPRQILLGAYVGAIGDETVFDGQDFTERFAAASTREAIGGGYRYRLTRDDGWPGAPSFRAFDADAVGPPSNGVAVTVAPAARRVLAPVSAYEATGLPILRAVQSSLVRLAAARGDLLALLALPEHYRTQDAVRHVTVLRDAIPEDTAWSYGALYHPWLLFEGPGDTDVVRAPPEGAMCGVMAARATTRGAWIAPANEPLRDVLGLSPAIPREQRQLLYETQVNLIRQEPHGFVVMSADTLSTDPDLIPINVRRLLALIRRIALREGPTFVFEPSSDVFRRAVERQFEVLLGDMFRAGAFAGDSPSSSFQVDVDTSINTDTSVDQGRFIVELRVAPSLPLGFITVRLVQASGLGQVTEGA
jgi:hypothetical protein